MRNAIKFSKSYLIAFLIAFLPLCVFGYDGDQILDNVQPEGGGTVDIQNVKSVTSIDDTTESTFESELDHDDITGAGTVDTDEEVQDSVGGILDNGTVGDIVFTYDDDTPGISATVEDDSHAHTGATLSGIDISDDTNLAGTANEITLTDDTLSLHANITRDSEWDTAAEINAATTDADFLTSETDPVFTAWDKSTGISITESQISDFGTYLTDITGESIFDLSGFPADPDADKYLKWDDNPGQLIWADGGSGGIDPSEFTTDGGVLVGTGAGTFQEETGATLRTSLGLGTGSSVQFKNLDLQNLAVNTDANYFGYRNWQAKTAGATDSSDYFYGAWNYIEFDQVSGALGNFIAQFNTGILTNGTVEYLTGFQTETQVGAAGTVNHDVSSHKMINTVSAGATVTGNIYALYLYNAVLADPGGTAYGLYLTESGSYIDYGIYQNGTAPNLLKGDLTLGSSSTGELTAGSINRASGSLTLEIGGTAELSIATGIITVKDGGKLKTDKVEAYDSAGLVLVEDGGLGLTIADSTGNATFDGTVNVKSNLTINSDLGDVTSKLIFGRTTGGNGEISYDGSFAVNKPLGINVSPTSGYLQIANDFSTGAWGVYVYGATGAARDIALFGQAGFSNGFTIQYTGTLMDYIFLNGGVKINTNSFIGSEKLRVNGDIYADGDVSAASFIDHTPFYEGDALSEIMKIKGKDGEIDHSTLPDFVRKKVMVNVYKDIENNAVNDILLNQDKDEKQPHVSQVKVGEEIEERRDLGAMISMLTVAVQQLEKEIEELKTKNKKEK